MDNEKRQYSLLQKIENFWYYYKWWVVVGVVFLIGIGIGIDFISSNTKEGKSDLTIISVFAHPLTAEEYNINERVTDCLGDINGDGVINAYLKPYYITKDVKTDEEQVSKAQFEADLSNCRGDILLFDEPNLEVYLKKDIFKPLDDLEYLSSVPKESIIYKNGLPVAVKLEKSQILSDMGFIIDEVYAGILFVPDDPTDEVLSSRQSAQLVLKKLLIQKEE